MDAPTRNPCAPTDPDEDARLVLRAQAGELDAFDALVAKHQSAVTALLYRFAPGRADLEDIVQETFVRAWRGLGKWRPEKPFAHWLKRVAVNVGLDFCRSRKRTPFGRLVEDAGASLENLPAKEAPDFGADAREILAQLPPEDRALLTLLHIEEMPLAEIAEHFGWSRANAKVKAFRARQRLQCILKRNGCSFE